MSAKAAILPHVQTDLDRRVRYFSRDGCVDHRGDQAAVYVGGHLIGTFCSEELVGRDLLVAIVCAEPDVRLGLVADAFGIHRETVRRILGKQKQGGLKGVAGGHRHGRPLQQTPQLEEELFALFDVGVSIRNACKRIDYRASRSVVARVRKKWADQRAAKSLAPVEAFRQVEIAVVDPHPDTVETMPDVEASEVEQDDEHALPSNNGPKGESNDTQQAACTELEVEEAVSHGTKRVRHLGAWIMLAMLNGLGLYTLAERLRANTERERRKDGKKYLGAVTLRAALDAVVVALCIGKRCVEGVRWLDAPSGPTLLRRARAISASWCRRVLAQFASNSALELHWEQGTSLMRSASAQDQRAVYYVDNHLRPYTGKPRILLDFTFDLDETLSLADPGGDRWTSTIRPVATSEDGGAT